MISWKITDWENQRRAKIANGAVRETNWEGGKMFRKIVDWATSKGGMEYLTGVILGIVGIIAVRLFCFLVCVVAG